MGVTKHKLHSSEHNRLADLAKVLGHPARIAIIQHLLNQNTCICSDLTEEIGLSQATISQHLKALRSSGIIKGKVEGSSRCYCIDIKTWTEAASAFAKLFSKEPYDRDICSS